MSPLVCITGMHRSGTSMVARALAAAGLWLGPPERLMPPQPDNAEGFFENLDLVRLADEMLERLGGAWDCPPPPLRADEPHVADALLAPLAEPAAQHLAALAAGAPGASSAGALAGWKDPRAALVLPFWQRLAPGLRVVACLREPVAVARSLQARNRVSLRYGIALWQAYNTTLLEQAQAGRLIVTHHDAWMADPAAELQRVATAVGLAPAEVALEAAAGSVRRVPRSPADLQAAADELWALGGAAAVGLYDRLRALAGPMYAATPSGERPADPGGAPPGDAAVPRRDVQLLSLQRRVSELGAELARLRAGAAPYRVGTSIDARKGGNAPLYLGPGWARPQEHGTWMLGTRAELGLPLHALPQGAGLALQARVRPLLVPGQPPVTATLHANGAVVGSWPLAEARPVTLECTLPATLLGTGQALRLAFEVDRACAPIALGLSADARPLGLLLANVILHPVPAG